MKIKQLLLFALFTAQASWANNETTLSLLDSSSMIIRTNASSKIYNSGTMDDVIYQKIEEILLIAINNLEKKSERANELSWHLKALSISGDRKYLGTIELFINSKNRKVSKYAKKSKKELLSIEKSGKREMSTNQVRVITDNQAESCTYLNQNSCKTSRSPDKCIEYHKVHAINNGGNAILILNSSSHRSTGISPWGKSTSMMANYYHCE